MAVILTCVLMWLGRRVAARAICLTLDLGFDLDLGIERDCNSHAAFRGVLRHNNASGLRDKKLRLIHFNDPKIKLLFSAEMFQYI